MRNTITGSLSSTDTASEFSVMLKDPSPAISTTGTLGLAALAPIEAGNPKPIVPRPVELKKVPGVITSKWRDAHIWHWPTSVVTIALAGNNSRNFLSDFLAVISLGWSLRVSA